MHNFGPHNGFNDPNPPRGLLPWWLHFFFWGWL